MAYTEGTVHRYRPSVLVFAAINLANSVLKTEHPDFERFRELFKVTTEELLGCFKELFHVLSSQNKYSLKAIKKKYGSERFQSVSKLRLEATN
jgi:hypothetical protein